MSEGFARTFEDLAVFRRSCAMSLEIHRASLGFPVEERFGLAAQIRRASKSIPANIAEGFGKQRLSKAEFNRFLTIAAGSADEMQVWTLYCRDLGYIEAPVAEHWREEYRAIAKMLQGLAAPRS